MTRARWDEAGLSEDPAVATLVGLGWTYVAPETLLAERDSTTEVVLGSRLAKALRRINPKLSDTNVQRAIRDLTSISATSLLDANERAHTKLTLGIALEEEQGGQRRSRQVPFIDFDSPRKG